MSEELSIDYLDRFSGIGRLYGRDAMSQLHAAHVAVVGIGGVGTWTAEALARSGVGELTLIDLDEICVTNINRQLHALDGQIGKPKVSALAERLRLINPAIVVHEEIAFFTEVTADRLLGPAHDCIVDAIDSVKQKAFLIATCKARGIPVVAVGGAGGKSNPAKLATDDLAFATNDRLLRLIRKELRRNYDFPPEILRDSWGIPAVYSTENARFPWTDGSVREEPEPGSELRLNCDSGFGTSAMVTGAFGLTAAAEAVRVLLQAPTRQISGEAEKDNGAQRDR